MKRKLIQNFENEADSQIQCHVRDWEGEEVIFEETKVKQMKSKRKSLERKKERKMILRRETKKRKKETDVKGEPGTEANKERKTQRRKTLQGRVQIKGLINICL